MAKMVNLLENILFAKMLEALSCVVWNVFEN